MTGKRTMTRLYDKYRETVIPQLMKDFGYRNVMEVPKLTKIVLNMGLGEAIQNVKILDAAVDELGAITGQKAVISRKSTSYYP